MVAGHRDRLTLALIFGPTTWADGKDVNMDQRFVSQMFPASGYRIVDHGQRRRRI